MVMLSRFVRCPSLANSESITTISDFAYAILGALFEKERHGTGQRVDCSQLGAMITLQTLSITNQLIYGKQPDDGNCNIEMLSRFACCPSR